MKKLFILLMLVGIGCPALCGEDFVYCGNYTSSYLYGTKTFVRNELRDRARQACTIKVNTNEKNDSKCSKREIKKTADNTLASCKVMSEATFQEVMRARKHKDWEYYYTIMNSLSVQNYNK